MGVRSKILSIAVVMLVIGMAAEAVTCGYIFATEFSKALQARALVLGESLRSELDRILRLGIPLHELVGFEKQCQELVGRNSDIGYAMVLDLKGGVLFHNDPSRQGKPVLPPVPGDTENHGGGLLYVHQNEVIVPVLNGQDEKIAAIHIGIRSSVINEKINHLMKTSVIVSLLALFMAAALLLLTLQWWVARPLSELFEAIRQLRRDERGFYGKIGLSSRDEIGQVGSAFDGLIENLNASHELIALHAEKLEATVEERTTELKGVNEQLERDIAKRKEMEEALRESEERWQFALEGAGDGVWDWNAQTNEVFFSRRWKAMLGFEDHEIGNTLHEWDNRVHPEERERAWADISRHFNGETPVYVSEHRMLCKDGTYRWALNRGKVISRTQGGAPLRVIGTLSDISERRRVEGERMLLERRLQQAQKAESLGRMAGAIAHHFNNLLGVMMGNLELALDDLSEESGTRANIAEAMTASHRAGEISRMMLAYLGQSAARKEPLNLVEVSRDAIFLLSPSLPKKVHLETELPSEGPVILADAMQVTQILTNLVSNAAEAIGDGEGGITLAIGLMAASEIRKLPLFPSDWGPRAPSYACLSVTDTGCGMDATTMEKIFDPFFSTKFTGRGLGLSVVLGVARTHEGAISVESRPGRGAVFRVFLPLSVQQALPPRKEAVRIAGLMVERGLVLLVEDEPMLRNLAQRMLIRLGYDVITACDGVEAVETFRTRKDELLFVLLDLTMPRMNGWEALMELRALRPDIPVVLSSGYDEAQVMQGAQRERPQAFLHKPYHVADLKAAIDGVRLAILE